MSFIHSFIRSVSCPARHSLARMPRRRRGHRRTTLGVGFVSALVLLAGVLGVVGFVSAERDADGGANGVKPSARGGRGAGVVGSRRNHHDYDSYDGDDDDPAVSCASHAVNGEEKDDGGDERRLRAEEFLYTVLRRTSASEGMCRCFPTFTSTTHASDAGGAEGESKKTPKTPRAPLLSLKEYKADMEEKMAEKQRQKEAKAREKEEKERKKKKEQDERDEEEASAPSSTTTTTTTSAATGEEVNATLSNHTNATEARASGADDSASGSESTVDASASASVEEKSNTESGTKEDAAAPESTDEEPTSEKKDADSAGNVGEADEEESPGGELVIKPSNFTKADGELYNYASSFNGAKVIASNSDAKHASAALKEDKDVYYISPCASEDKFITVELSEEVAVTSVVLGNFEFHSSAVKDFELWGTDGHHAVEDGWRRLMVGRAENTKNVQKFVFPSPAWVHYVQIRITSHYDAQHFCTLSLLRVHGKDAKETLAEEMAKLAQEVQEVEQLLSDEDGEDDEDAADEDDEDDERNVVADSERDAGVVADENASNQAAAQLGGNGDKIVADADDFKSTSDARDGSSDIHERMKSTNATVGTNATVRSATNDTATNASASNVTANGTSIAPSSRPKLATGSEMTGGGGENVFRLLAQKIKDLELNQSLLSRYVDSLNARYGETLSEFGVEIDAIEESVKNSTGKLDEASRKAKASSQACDDAVARVKLASEKLVSTAIAELEAYRRAIEKRDTALAFALTLAAGALVASRRSTGTIERILSATASFVLLALCVLTSLIIARTKVLEAGDDAKLLQ